MFFGPHTLIIGSALSLGGMASVGLSHFQQVEQQLVEHREMQTADNVEAEISSELAESMQEGLSELEKNLESRRTADVETQMKMISEMKDLLADVQRRANSHEILLGQLDKEQSILEFKVETHERSFRPLRSIDSRFQRLRPNGSDVQSAHPLLPDLEPSWTDDY